MKKNLSKEQATENLLHYGVVGMKWGRRQNYTRAISKATKQHKKVEDTARIAAHAERKGKIVKAATYNAKNQVAKSKYDKYIDTAARMGESKHSKYADAGRVFTATMAGGPFAGMSASSKIKKENPHALEANKRRKQKGYQ